MLSDEEKESIEEFRKQLRLAINIDDVTTAIRNDNAQTILNLIEKLQKENEELKDESKEYQIGFAQGCYDKDLDWKDKIKAKILECRKILYSFEKELELKANKEKYIHKESMNCLLSQISILQSLLEKEGE